ncbi:hypothetical protein ABT218_33715 [Streptomyces sp. NPDC001455]|uniref:hypothetical protein n=1 Tax=Streptomyces sp. NPDC001455 TaxID=3154518 RepID=UPI00331B8D44
MLIPAVLVAETVAWQSGDGLVPRMPGAGLVGLLNGGHVEVFALAGVAKGEVRACARIPVPDTQEVSDFTLSWAIAPDASFAVFGMPEGVVAVGADGVERWVRRQGMSDEDLVHRSCAVSRDGKYVWALVVGDEDPDDGDMWAVLDSATGEVIAQTALDGMTEYYATQSLHPDGVHVLLSIGEGQNGCYTYWSRLPEEADGENVDEDEGRPPLLNYDGLADDKQVLLDISPDGGEFLTAGFNKDLRRHRFPDGEVLTTLARNRVPLSSPKDDGWVTWEGGYLTANTCLVVSSCGDESLPQPSQHWVYQLSSDELRGPVLYPSSDNGSVVRCLGDGTWLTTDAAGTGLLRWRL